jgi:arginase
MELLHENIQIVSAPSILGLKPSGVQRLPDALLTADLREALGTNLPVVKVPVLNEQYSNERDENNCLNSKLIIEFSSSLGNAIQHARGRKFFPVVLGGDCSILLGIMPALKKLGRFGLVFFDAHADFYTPVQSPTGELADMELAILTGRGPQALTNIDNLKPYVRESDVVHIGQRDIEETRIHGAEDVRRTEITCFSFEEIKRQQPASYVNALINSIAPHLNEFWIHFDTDVLSDEINPAVDYRLPGGLSFDHVQSMLKALLRTGRAAGISITIFNPDLDHSGRIAAEITGCLCKAFEK